MRVGALLLVTTSLASGNSVQLDAARDIQLDAVTRQITATRQTASGQVSGSNTEVGPQGSVVSRGDLAINAGRDIRLAGALVSAQGNASLNAGASLVAGTVQTQQTTQDVSGMGVRRSQGSTNLASTVQTGGSLSLTSGGDTTLRAAQVGAGQDVSIVSGGNLTILNATNTAQLDEAMRAKGYVRNDHTAQERVVGSNIVAGGNVTLAALQTAPDGNTSQKGNITVQGSSINAVTGQLNVVAANNVNLIDAREKGEYDLFNETKGSKTFSSKTQTAHDTGSSDIAVGSSLSGKTVNIDAGRNLTVRGSSVVSDNKTTLLATNNITIEAAQNFETSTTFREEKKSGLMSSGGIGFTVGSKQQSTDQQDTRTSASASTLGSIAGNVTATAGSNYRQVGSDMLTPAGNVTISAQKVDITEARETSQSATEQKFKQSGVTLSLGSPLISAVQGAQNMAQAASQTSDARMQALAGATTALNLYSNREDIEKAATALSNGDVSKAVSLSISVGSSKSQNNASSQSNSARGSSITAGGDVTIAALGAGQASDLTVQGSAITAGNNAQLLADNEIKLLAARNDFTQKSSNSASSGAIGVSIGASTGVTLSASKARGNADGSDTSYSNTVIQAGKTATLDSGSDTTLRGAVVAASQVIANVGGNLAIQSLQDTSTYTGQQSSTGASITIGPGVIPTGGGFSASKSNIDSNYQSVVQQSGIKAGDGGFQVAVNKTTDLKGGVISSTEAALALSRNTFTTGALSFSDIRNSASYSGKAVGISMDVGNQAGKFGVSGIGVGIGSDKGDAASTTTAGISGIAGNTAVRSTDAETGIGKIFDAAKVQREIDAQVQITQAFGKEASSAIGTYAKTQLAQAEIKQTEGQIKQQQATRAQNEGRLKDAAALQRQADAALQEASSLRQQWGETGTARVGLHTLAGLLGGGVAGAGGAAASTLSAPAIDSAIAQLDLPDSLRNVLVAGAASTLGGAVGGTAGAAGAINEAANNYLTSQQEIQRDKEMTACKTLACTVSVKMKYRGIDLMQDTGLIVGVGGGMGYQTVEQGLAMIEMVKNLPETLTALKAIVSDPEFRAKVGNQVADDYKQRIEMQTRAYNEGGWDGSITAGVEAGRLAVDIVAAATVAMGMSKVTVKVVSAGSAAVTGAATTLAVRTAAVFDSLDAVSQASWLKKTASWRIATIELAEMELQAGSRSHPLLRHGDQVELSQLQERALKGITPDGVQGSPVDSTRWLNNEDMLAAIKQAQSNFSNSGGTALKLEVDLGRVIGDGYFLGTSTYAKATKALVLLDRNGLPRTAYPVLR